MKPIDIILLAGLALLVTGIAVRLIIKKKKGESGCGCGCNGCPSAGVCGVKKEQKEEKEHTHV